MINGPRDIKIHTNNAQMYPAQLEGGRNEPLHRVGGWRGPRRAHDLRAYVYPLSPTSIVHTPDGHFNLSPLLTHSTHVNYQFSKNSSNHMTISSLNYQYNGNRQEHVLNLYT